MRMSEDKIAQSLGIVPLAELQDSDEEIKEVTQVIDEATPANIEKFEETLPAVQETNDQNINDIELARQNVQNIIEMGDDAVKEMVEIAKQSESPRAFEVVSTLMKTLLDANKDFVDLSTKKKYAVDDTGPKAESNVTNNNLIVSTADLLKMIKGEGEE
jgi:hypothetical protein